jgi:hypothetical protein
MIVTLRGGAPFQVGQKSVEMRTFIFERLNVACVFQNAAVYQKFLMMISWIPRYTCV